jgi:multidrug efflux system membrane fusion protein
MIRTLTLAAAALSVAACGNGAKPEDPARPVIAVTVAPGATATRDVYSGDVHARVETDLAFRIAGKIAARMVDAGARVRRGQALARLDPEDSRLAAASSRAQLASAEADYALAKAELDRSADLLAKKFISQSAFDARLAAHAAARARVDQTRSQSALSENQEGYATLHADADGVVVSTSAEPGQVVTAGTPVLRLAREGEMEVVISVPEGRIARFRPGLDVAMSLWANPAVVFPGRVREIAGGADPVTRTFTVRVTALRPPPAMRVGMSANVALREEGRENVVVIPLTALVNQKEDAAVWVVDPGTSRVRRRPVKVGQYREDGATIEEGLSAGETVVAAGAHKLREDQLVRAPGIAFPGTAAASASR